MANRNIIVSFPLDSRKGNLKNDLLDGEIHKIRVDKISTFNTSYSEFYIIVGHDITRDCPI